MKESFTGFVLYDPEKEAFMAEEYPDHYFTPASNTKLYTFFAGIQLLGDSVPALRYEIHGDSLIFEGTGSPAFLNADLGDSATFEFLASHQGGLYYRQRPWKDDRLGPGWSWSDYNSYYSSEKAVFPIYGNNATFYLSPYMQGKPEVMPAILADSITVKKGKNANWYQIQRGEQNNHFEFYPEQRKITKPDTLLVPLRLSDATFMQLLSDTLKRSITPYQGPALSNPQTYYSIPIDTLYRHMLQPSDNLYAEQILLMCSGQLGDTLSSRKAIEHVLKMFLSDLPSIANWVDGSGLSRYNMFTPRTTVVLLKKLRQQVGEERLFQLLGEGGVSGTIRNWYAGNPSYVFAKTGTLSNNHCLSGYLLTNSGRTLIFSFMHNHYLGSSTPNKKYMEQMLQFIRDNF